MPSGHPFVGSHLVWPFRRETRRFTVHVVEPREIAPHEHGAILNAVLGELVNPPVRRLDTFDDVPSLGGLPRFDLVTFPEAFATPEDLIEVAKALAKFGPSGCLHVGLRASSSSGTHLFKVTEMHDLVSRLEEVAGPDSRDLSDFKEWLARQNLAHRFNLGCLLAIDEDGRLRTCLHPKIVASRYEVDALRDQNMKEADLLTLVTLRPSGGMFGTVTLQPLICSDVLNIPTERMTGPPIMAVTQHAACFTAPPDHVDIVSVATCTPQPRGKTKAGLFAQWHLQFLDAFLASAGNPGCSRHSYATIVLANYLETHVGSGGLSGVFMPTPAGFSTLDQDVTISCFGLPGDGTWANNGWSVPARETPDKFRARGFVAGLDPERITSSARARVFGFSLHHLPREAGGWSSSGPSILEPEVMICAPNEQGALRLRAREDLNA